MGATAATESQIRVLIEAVDRADREGNRREAERALAQARAAAPEDPRVLNVAGMRALLGGDAGAARPLLERAAAADPGSPALRSEERRVGKECRPRWARAQENES